jgi:hypothetical protein
MKNSVFWDTTPHKPLKQAASKALLAAGFMLVFAWLTFQLETLVNFQRTKYDYIPEDITLQCVDIFLVYLCAKFHMPSSSDELVSPSGRKLNVL